jgi:ATP-binding cassette subfamily B protein
MISKKSVLLSILRGKITLFLTAIAATGIGTLLSFFNPLILRSVIDSLTGSASDNSILVRLFPFFSQDGGASLLAAGFLVVGVTLLGGVCTFVSGTASAHASEGLTKSLRDRMYRHLQYLSYDWHVKAETGDLVQRCTSDVETIRRFFAVQSVEMARVVFLMGIALPLMFGLNVQLTLVSLPMIPVMIAFSYLFFKRVQRYFGASDEAEGALSSVLQENIGGVRVVRAFARQTFEIGKFERVNSRYRDLTYRLIVLLAVFWTVTAFLGLFQIGVVLLMGVRLASRGVITVGTLLVFILYENMLIWPMRQMGRILADMGKASVSLFRITEILSVRPEDMEDGGSKPVVEGGVEFRSVSFTYPGTDRPVLSDISFSVHPGMTVAVLGATGSGKTSLIQLLGRFYDCTEGEILIDGTDIRSISKRHIREQIGYVMQEPFLYGKTVGENIGLAVRDASESAISDAAKSAAIHESILAFEKGYETLVGERGVTLSGGQKQRLRLPGPFLSVLRFDLRRFLKRSGYRDDSRIRKSLKAVAAGMKASRKRTGAGSGSLFSSSRTGFRP